MANYYTVKIYRTKIVTIFKHNLTMSYNLSNCICYPDVLKSGKLIHSFKATYFKLLSLR